MIRSFRQLLVVALLIGIGMPLCAQKKEFTYNFYGFIRSEAFYNSRKNAEGFDGLFYLYPLDKVNDAQGKDLNALPDAYFYMFASRLGVNVQGPLVGKAKSSARIEADFAGAAGLRFLLRIRHAYARLDWDGGSSVLAGQTWHPFFGEVMPQMMNLSTGAPFQPFNRSPQIQYQFNRSRFSLKASAVYQLMYMSYGPLGQSKDYLKNSMLPELCLNLDYVHNGFRAGVGVEMLSIKPRTQSTMQQQTYRVNEQLTSFSYEAHALYTRPKLYLSGKALLTSNMAHTTILGGYGVTQKDALTGQQTYAPFRHAGGWINGVYGQKWQLGGFAGYTKNLGSSKPLHAAKQVYGMGLDVDQLLAVSAQLSYNLPHWRLGIEYQASTAWYGDLDASAGKLRNTHDVTNHRVAGLLVYLF